MSFFGCRITEVIMSVFASMLYYRGDHECLCSDVVLQGWP